MKEKKIPIPDDLTNTSGLGLTIVGDKCDSHWTDKECPNEPVYQEYHYGQFGHKVVFQFCAECYKNCLKHRESHWFFKEQGKDRGFEYIRKHTSK